MIEAWDQRNKDLVEAWAVLGKAKARATKAEKALGDVEAKSGRADAKDASAEAKVAKVEVGALAVEEAPCKAKDQTSMVIEEVQVVEVLAFEAIVKVVEASGLEKSIVWRC